jgi:hypothetical protein
MAMASVVGAMALGASVPRVNGSKASRAAVARGTAQPVQMSMQGFKGAATMCPERAPELLKLPGSPPPSHRSSGAAYPLLSPPSHCLLRARCPLSLTRLSPRLRDSLPSHCLLRARCPLSLLVSLSFTALSLPAESWLLPQGDGVTELLAGLEALLQRTMIDMDVLIPYTEGALLGELHTTGVISDEEFLAEGTRVRVHLPYSVASKVRVSSALSWCV